MKKYNRDARDYADSRVYDWFFLTPTTKKKVLWEDQTETFSELETPSLGEDSNYGSIFSAQNTNKSAKETFFSVLPPTLGEE